MAKENRQPEIAYQYEGRVYLNITNRCPTACRFCAKHPWGWSYRGAPLRLLEEPTAGAIIRAADASLEKAAIQEAVFCGFGEPTERLGVVLDVASVLKALRPRLKMRLNTVGLGSLTQQRNIAPELAAVLDTVSVSLNTANPEQWLAMHRPRVSLRGASVQTVCDFIRDCVRAGLHTTATAVDQPGVDLSSVEALARSLGAHFRLRPPLLAGAGT